MIRNFLKFASKILFSSQQILVTCIMFFALTSLLLFYLLFKTFETNYIDQLKSVFPNMHIVASTKIDTQTIEEFEISYEIFEQIWTNITIGFNENDFYALSTVGIRSFAPEYIPPILQGIYKSTETLYVTQNVYDLMTSQKNFNGKVFIESDIDHKLHSFDIVPFKIQDNKKWILFPNPAAHKLYRKNLFDKAVFYSKLPDDIALKKLQKTFTKTVFTWDDFISLTSIAVKNSMLFIFTLLSLAIVTLLLLSLIFFAQTLFDDLKQLTRYAFFYGIQKRTLFGLYFLLLNAYLFIIYFLSYGVASLISNTLVQKLWSVEQTSLSHKTLFASTLIFTALGLMVYLHMEEKRASIKVSRG